MGEWHLEPLWTLSDFCWLNQCALGLSLFNNCIRENCPFAPIFKGNNCFRVKYLDVTFTFDIYLGTSWIEATAAKEWIDILRGWWKDVFQIFGTSWMLSGSVVLVNENIGRYLHHEQGVWPKKLFLSMLRSRVWFGSVRNFNFISHTIHVFRPWQIFVNICRKFFSPESLSGVPKQIHKVSVQQNPSLFFLLF